MLQMDLLREKAIFSSAEIQEMQEAVESLDRAYPVIDAKLCIVTWKMANRHRIGEFRKLAL